MYKFSIVIPTYNTKKEFFKQCIDSIKRQSYENFEVIIIDDGSNEELYYYYKQTIENDKRFSIVNQKNKGVSIARNNGVERCKGDYLIFIDSDDYIEENLLEKMLQIIIKYNKCDVILFENFTDNKKEEDIVKLLKSYDREVLIQKLMDENNWLNNKSKLKHFGSVWNKCYKLDYVKRNNIKLVDNVKYSEDVLYSIKALFLTNNIVYTNYKLYHYRIYGESTFDKYNNNADLDFINFIIELKKVLIELDLYNKMYKAYLIKVYTSYQFVMTLKFFNKNNNIKNNKYFWKKFNNNQLINEMIFKLDKSKINLKGKIVIFFAKYNLYFPIKLIYNLKNNIR